MCMGANWFDWMESRLRSQPERGFDTPRLHLLERLKKSLQLRARRSVAMGKGTPAMLEWVETHPFTRMDFLLCLERIRLNLGDKGDEDIWHGFSDADINLMSFRSFKKMMLRYGETMGYRLAKQGVEGKFGGSKLDLAYMDVHVLTYEADR